MIEKQNEKEEEAEQRKEGTNRQREENAPKRAAVSKLFVSIITIKKTERE